MIESVGGEVCAGPVISRVLHHLTHLRKNEPVWQLVRQSDFGTGPKEEKPDDPETTHRLLGWMAVTPAGRLIPPDFFIAVRRAQYLATVDEVRKAVAYALVAAGYPLVAVTDEEFVLEVPESEVSPEYERRLSEVMNAAQRKLFGAPARTNGEPVIPSYVPPGVHDPVLDDLAAPDRWRPT